MLQNERNKMADPSNFIGFKEVVMGMFTGMSVWMGYIHNKVFGHQKNNVSRDELTQSINSIRKTFENSDKLTEKNAERMQTSIDRINDRIDKAINTQNVGK